MPFVDGAELEGKRELDPTRGDAAFCIAAAAALAAVLELLLRIFAGASLWEVSDLTR